MFHDLSISIFRVTAKNVVVTAKTKPKQFINTSLRLASLDGADKYISFLESGDLRLGGRTDQITRLDFA